MQAAARTLTLDLVGNVLDLALDYSHDERSRPSSSLVVDARELQMMESWDLMAVVSGGRARRSATGVRGS